MVNKALIIGRLGADVTLRYSQDGNTAFGSFRVATDESYTDRDGNKVERSEWHTVQTRNRQAENCAKYLGKGSLVYVEGSMHTRKWQDQEGNDRYSHEIKAYKVQFLDRKQSSQGDRSQDPPSDSFESNPNDFSSGIDDVPF